MTKVILIWSTYKVLNNLLLNPNAVNLFLCRMEFQATDRWLLIHTCKFIYDWKSVHITHFKNIIRVHMRFMFFSCSFLIIVIDFILNTTANVYWVLIVCQALFKGFTCIVISSYQSSNVDGDYVIILPVWKLRKWEVTKLAQRSTGNKWKSSLFVLNHNATDSLSVCQLGVCKRLLTSHLEILKTVSG